MLAGHSPPGSGAPRRRRGLRFLAWLVLGMVAVLALAYGLRERLIAPLVLRQVSARLRAELGADLSVARVSGDWVRELVLEGVRWRSPRPPLLRVDEGRVELRYSLRELVRGEKGWLHSVTVRGRGVALSAGERAESTGSSAALELPALASTVLEPLAPFASTCPRKPSSSVMPCCRTEYSSAYGTPTTSRSGGFSTVTTAHPPNA